MVGALLPIVDPLSTAPVYLQVTADVEAQSRSRLARLVAIDCFLLLLASTLLGKYVLYFFGLPLADVQVGGGIVVCAIAQSLLNKHHPADLSRPDCLLDAGGVLERGAAFQNAKHEQPSAPQKLLKS